MESFASQLAIGSAGGFFLVALITGAWKYHHIATSQEARAPYYVDIAHRASLLYAFACVLIERFVVLSSLSPTLETVAVAAQVVFFALSVLSYIVHGALRDTDNQLAKPHKLGSGTVSPAAMALFMWSLIVAEIGGFAVLLYGAVA